MKNLKKLLDKNTSHQQIETMMSQLLEQKFDAEKRARYEKILAEKYQIIKHDTKATKSSKKSMILLGSMIFLVIALISVYFFTTDNEVNYQQLALNYHTEQPFAFNLKDRSVVDNSIVLEAYNDYEAGNFDQTIAKLEEASKVSHEQLFLLGYAYYAQGDYAKASSKFSTITNESGDKTYVSESNFYQILSLFAIGQNDSAYSKMNSLEPTSWEIKELSKLGIVKR